MGTQALLFLHNYLLSSVPLMLTSRLPFSALTVIGSEPVGRKIAHAAAELMIPTCIELGGKDCALLLPNADVDFFGGIFMRAAL